jgi:hypothetical protein
MSLSSRIYYVNSINRLSGDCGNFSYKLSIPAGSTFDSVCVLQADIPISYYLVPPLYNRFFLTETGFPATMVTVPVGNYNALSFATVVKNCLNQASPNRWIYNIQFPQSYTSVSTAKYTFSVVGTGSVSFTFSDALFEQFGFDANSTVTFNTTIVSKNVVLFVPETSLIIHSDIVNDGDTDVLQVIFNNNSLPFSTAVYQCPDPNQYSKPLRTNQSNVYQFSITDEHGRTVDLNGVNCVFSLLIFKRDNLTQLVKSYMRNMLRE